MTLNTNQLPLMVHITKNMANVLVDVHHVLMISFMNVVVQNVVVALQANPMNISCLISRHEWAKMGGAHNAGNGKFSQNYKCKKCGKVKEVVS